MPSHRLNTTTSCLSALSAAIWVSSAPQLSPVSPGTGLVVRVLSCVAVAQIGHGLFASSICGSWSLLCSPSMSSCSGGSCSHSWRNGHAVPRVQLPFAQFMQGMRFCCVCWPLPLPFSLPPLPFCSFWHLLLPFSLLPLPLGLCHASWRGCCLPPT